MGVPVGWGCGMGVWDGGVGWECGMWDGSVGWECGVRYVGCGISHNLPTSWQNQPFYTTTVSKSEEAHLYR